MRVTHRIAPPSRAAAPTISSEWLQPVARKPASEEPRMAPRLAAAERMPKSRFDCPVSTMSTISIQKTETTKRLKTDSQTKKA